MDPPSPEIEKLHRKLAECKGAQAPPPDMVELQDRLLDIAEHIIQAQKHRIEQLRRERQHYKDIVDGEFGEGRHEVTDD